MLENLYYLLFVLRTFGLQDLPIIKQKPHLVIRGIALKNETDTDDA